MVVKKGKKYERKRRVHRKDKDLKHQVVKSQKGHYVMVNPTPFKLRLPVPEGYYTTLTCNYLCNVASGLAAANNIGIFQANNPFTPFSVLTAPFRNSGPPTSPDELAYATKNPAGLTNIIGASALYNAYHVIKYYFRLTWIVESLGDSMIIGIAPTLGAGTQYGTMGSLEDGPMSKTRLCTTSVPTKDCSVSLAIDCPKYQGLTVAQYIADPNMGGSYSSGPTSLNSIEVQARYATLDGAVTGVQAACKIELRWDVYFHNQTTGGLNDV